MTHWLPTKLDRRGHTGINENFPRFSDMESQ